MVVQALLLLVKIKVEILRSSKWWRKLVYSLKWKSYQRIFRFREFIQSHRNKPVKMLGLNWNMFCIYLPVGQSRRKKCPSPLCMICPYIIKYLVLRHFCNKYLFIFSKIAFTRLKIYFILIEDYKISYYNILETNLLYNIKILHSGTFQPECTSNAY